MMDAELYLPSARSTSRMIDTHTLADTFGLLAPTPPAALVGDSPRRAIATLTRCLPATLTNWQHLECRLDHSSAVDLIGQVEGRVALSRLSALSNGRSHPGWMGAGALAAAAAAADVPRALARLWLEFDVDADDDSVRCGRSLHAPSVFAELTPAGARGVTDAMRDAAID